MEDYPTQNQHNISDAVGILHRVRKVGIWSAVLTIIAAIAVIVPGLNDTVIKCDVAIVLGSKVELSGKPSDRLAARLDAAIPLFKNGFVRHIIVSGGTGVEGFSEAAVMRQYLEKRGIPTTAIIEDSMGVTTWATAKNSAKIMDQLNAKNAIVVSQYFHIVRAKLALEANGVTVNGSVHAQFFEARDIYSIFREIPGILSYWWKYSAS